MKRILLAALLTGATLLGMTQDKPTRCSAITKKGTQCTRIAKKDGLCQQHRNIELLKTLNHDKAN